MLYQKWAMTTNIFYSKICSFGHKTMIFLKILCKRKISQKINMDRKRDLCKIPQQFYAIFMFLDAKLGIFKTNIKFSIF